MVRVRPGVRPTRAMPLRPTRLLIRLDLPTFERPENATVGSGSCGYSVLRIALLTNWTSTGWFFDHPLTQDCYWGESPSTEKPLLKSTSHQSMVFSGIAVEVVGSRSVNAGPVLTLNFRRLLFLQVFLRFDGSHRALESDVEHFIHGFHQNDLDIFAYRLGDIL